MTLDRHISPEKMEAEELALQAEALAARKNDVATKLRQPSLSTDQKVALEEEYVLLLRASVALSHIERSLQNDCTSSVLEPEPNQLVDGGGITAPAATAQPEPASH